MIPRGPESHTPLFVHLVGVLLLVGFYMGCMALFFWVMTH